MGQVRQRTTELPVATPDADDEVIGLVNGEDSRIPLSTLPAAVPPLASQVPASTTGHTELTGTTVQAQLDEADAALAQIGQTPDEVDVHRAETPAHQASQITYDNATSGLAAADTQQGIDEVAASTASAADAASAAQVAADAAQSTADTAQSDAAAAQATADVAQAAAVEAQSVAGQAMAEAEAASAAVTDRVAKAGDTMSGPLVLAADPAADMEAATKQYVDQVIAAALAAL